MKTALRTGVGVVVGLIVAFALIFAVEYFGDVVHPLPEGVGKTMEEICRHVESFPPWALAVVVPLWGVTALAGTSTAQRIGSLYATVIVGLVLLAALVLNISMLPYPLWFKIANLLVVPAASIAGSRLFRRHKTAGTSESR